MSIATFVLWQPRYLLIHFSFIRTTIAGQRHVETLLSERSASAKFRATAIDFAAKRGSLENIP